MYTKALRCSLAPGFWKSSQANLMSQYICNTITGPSRWGERGSEAGKDGDKYKVVCYPVGYSFTKQHSQSLSHNGSLQKDYMESKSPWHSPWLGEKESHLFVGFFLSPVSPWSNFTQWDVKTALCFQVVLSSSFGLTFGEPSLMPIVWCFPWNHTWGS